MHVVVGLGQIQITGAAGSQDGLGPVGLLLGKRQVAGNQRVGRGDIEGEVFGGTAAVPVLDLMQVDAKRFANSFHGGFVGFGA